MVRFRVKIVGYRLVIGLQDYSSESLSYHCIKPPLHFVALFAEHSKAVAEVKRHVYVLFGDRPLRILHTWMMEYRSRRLYSFFSLTQ